MTDGFTGWTEALTAVWVLLVVAAFAAYVIGGGITILEPNGWPRSVYAVGLALILVGLGLRIVRRRQG